MNSDLQSESNKPPIEIEHSRKLGNGPVWVLGSVPWVLMALIYFFSPEYFMHLFLHANCTNIFIGFVVWESAGCLLLSLFRHPMVWLAVSLFCVVPATLEVLFGPAICFPMALAGHG